MRIPPVSLMVVIFVIITSGISARKTETTMTQKTKNLTQGISCIGNRRAEKPNGMMNSDFKSGISNGKMPLSWAGNGKTQGRGDVIKDQKWPSMS